MDLRNYTQAGSEAGEAPDLKLSTHSCPPWAVVESKQAEPAQDLFH